MRRGATLEEGRPPTSLQPSLRDGRLRSSNPWTEVHGYHHQVAPRLQETEMRHEQLGGVGAVADGTRVRHHRTPAFV